jgi:hypothetical protein
MKTRTALIGLGVAAALAAGIGAYNLTASAQGGPGYGPGMMGGYGPGYGHMRGWGGGPGAGSWNCPAFGQNDESGPAGRQGEGYGPGFHMRGWGGGYGPGMMQGYGPGYGPRGDVQGNQTLNLSTDDVKNRMERWLAARDNPRLKIGEVKEKDADSITAEVVTKENSLVERFIIDRHTGFTRRDNS